MVALDARKLGWAPGAETGSRGGGWRLVCEAHGREESQQRAQARENWRTARLVRRRGASTAVLGVRAGRWRRVERPGSFGRSQGRGAARAWRVAGGLDSDGDLGSVENRGGRERREGEREMEVD